LRKDVAVEFSVSAQRGNQAAYSGLLEGNFIYWITGAWAVGEDLQRTPAVSVIQGF
jgi:hypothetical protein